MLWGRLFQMVAAARQKAREDVTVLVVGLDNSSGIFQVYHQPGHPVAIYTNPPTFISSLSLANAALD